MEQKITLNMIPGGVLPIAHASQNDNNRDITFLLTEGGSDYTLGALTTVQITLKRPDGAVYSFYPTFTTDTNEIKAAFFDDLTAVAGDCIAEVRVDDGSKIGSANFILRVEPSPEDAVIYNSIVTNKQGLIVFGGRPSTDYGIVVSEAPTFEKPTRKQTIINIPGRSGSIVRQEDAWNDVTRKYKIWVAKDRRQDLVRAIEAVTGWLNRHVGSDMANYGYFRLEDSFEPEYYRLAYYSGGDSFVNDLMQAGEAELKFTCRPERFLKSGDIEQEITGASFTLYNPTNFKAKPIITFEATGPSLISFIGGGGGSLSFALASGDAGISFDCETLQAFNCGGANGKTSYSSEPYLDPGLNACYTTGTYSKLFVTPRFYVI